MCTVKLASNFLRITYVRKYYVQIHQMFIKTTGQHKN